MTVPGNLSSPLLATATGAAAAAAEYVIPKSLRFNSDDTSYLNRTPSAAGNRRTWTLSWWMKLANPKDTDPQLFSIYTDANNRSGIFLDTSANYQLGFYSRVGGTTQLVVITDAVLRDYSAWYHCVISVDTTEATSSDRAKIYINGVEQSLSSSTYPSQNYETYWNLAAQHDIGRYGGATQLFDGLMADIQFVDGQALAPTDFGETRSSDGVWVPKEFTGFGKNPNDGTTWSSSLTTNAGDNFDSSGAKTKAFDGSTSTKAYTANNSDGTTQNTSYIQLNSPKAFTGNLKVICDNGNAIYDVTGGGSTLLATNSTGSDGALIDCGTVTSADKIRVLMAGGSRPAIAAIYIDGNALLDDAVDNSFHLNFSDSSTIEALGFDSAPTTPDPDPKKGMDVITYTGTGAVQNIGGALFEPGLIWTKMRNATGYSNKLVDSVRGATKSLVSNNTNAELTEANGVKTINPDGFTLGTQEAYNKNNNTFVAWIWRAGGPAVTKTAGTINAEVSANTDYGFSICKFTGTGTAGTIEHGLSTVPKWYIVKNLDTQPSEWNVFHVSTGETKRLKLNSNSAAQTASNSWNDTAPTASLFTVGTDTDVNKSGDEHIAYVWSEVSGFSKFGVYAGSGASGKQVTGLGFKPRYLLVKAHDASASWVIVDSERGGDKLLFAEANNADSSGDTILFLDDGFQIQGGGGDQNYSGRNYIYAAFADRPGNNWDVNNIVTNEGLTTSKTQFDVVTYAGNGGTQKIGGAVFSASAASSITNASNIFDGSTSTGGYSSSTGTDLTLTTSSFTISTQLRVYNNFRSDGTYAICLNGTCVTVAGSGTDSTQYRWSTVDLSGFTLPLTVTSLGYSASQTSGNTIRAVEVDSSILIDGTGPGLKFQPDLVWIKVRNESNSHYLFDSVRGADKALFSDSTSAETDYSSTGRMTAFNSDGFTVKYSNSTGTNASGDNYVAWCWKAGGTAVSNTDGSITSSVSANAAYGFSIIKFTTASDTSGGATVGHGLSAQPSLYMYKPTSTTGEWVVVSSHDYDQFAYLNATTQFRSISSNGGGTPADPTNSVLSLYDLGVTLASKTYICYAFANVPGYQRIGSYVGNGSSTGPVIPTGFRPRFLMIKKTSGTGPWYMYDSERDNAGNIDKLLQAESSAAEFTTGANYVDFQDSGFQLKGTGGDTNASGGTYVYLAIGDDEIGSDEDCLVDVPNAVTADAGATDTTGGYQRGNYATLNPLVASHTYSNGNLDFTFSTTGNTSIPPIQSTIAMPSGKWYAEMTMGSGATGMTVGLWNSENFTNDHPGSTADSYAYWSGNGNKYNNDTNSSYGDSFTEGDVIGVAFDADNGTLEFYKNGVSQGTAYTGITSRNYVFAGHKGTSGTDVRSGKWNFGQMRFKYPMPSGYAALNTTALPAATIPDGSDYFDTKLYTGNSSTQTISGYEFSPDLVWLKSRSHTYDHYLTDTVRGATKSLRSNTTAAEDTLTQGLTAFTSDGFSVGNEGQFNNTGRTMVAWTWDAGSSTVSNTDGSITSNVRANPSAGFSIVTYSVPSSGTTFSVGHGLGAAPSLIIAKDREGSNPWGIYHSALGVGKGLLFSTAAEQVNSNWWNNTNPTSTLFYLNTGIYAHSQPGNDYVAYCISPVAGYSAVGSYTGNGSSDGPFVYTGFRPAIIIQKRTDSTGSWTLVDTARDIDNPAALELLPNSGAAEYDNTSLFDILSNGFKVRATFNNLNASSGSFIYIAFASNPFQANGGLAR